MAGLTPDWDWAKAAVIARDWRFLMPVRSLCEALGIPVQTADQDGPNFWRLRETRLVPRMAGGAEGRDGHGRRGLGLARRAGRRELLATAEGRLRRVRGGIRRGRGADEGPDRMAGGMGARPAPEADRPAPAHGASRQGPRVRPCRGPRRQLGAARKRRGPRRRAQALLRRHDPGAARPDPDVPGSPRGIPCSPGSPIPRS